MTFIRVLVSTYIYTNSMLDYWTDTHLNMFTRIHDFGRRTEYLFFFLCRRGFLNLHTPHCCNLSAQSVLIKIYSKPLIKVSEGVWVSEGVSVASKEISTTVTSRSPPSILQFQPFQQFINHLQHTQPSPSSTCTHHQWRRLKPMLVGLTRLWIFHRQTRPYWRGFIIKDTCYTQTWRKRPTSPGRGGSTFKHSIGDSSPWIILYLCRYSNDALRWTAKEYLEFQAFFPSHSDNNTNATDAYVCCTL
jgi:hypothetical protein